MPATHDPLVLELWWPLQWQAYSSGNALAAYPKHHPCVRRVTRDMKRGITKFVGESPRMPKNRGGAMWATLYEANDTELITIRSIMLHLASDDYFRGKSNGGA